MAALALAAGSADRRQASPRRASGRSPQYHRNHAGGACQRRKDRCGKLLVVEECRAAQQGGQRRLKLFRAHNPRR
jgi:hypothetical protein